MANVAPVTVNVDGDFYIATDKRRLRNFLLLGAFLFTVFAINSVAELRGRAMMSVLPQLVLAALMLILVVYFAGRWWGARVPAVKLSPKGFADVRVNPNPVAWTDVRSISQRKGGYRTEWLEMVTGKEIARAHHTGWMARLLSSNPDLVFVDTSTLKLDLEDVAEIFTVYWNYHAPQQG